MDPDNYAPKAVFGIRITNVLKTEKGEFILQDDTGLTIVEPNGNYWESERISWDEIVDVRYENGLVTGKAFDPTYDAEEWVGFSYHLSTKTLVGGSYNRYLFTKKRAWWKFWTT